jgi:phage terminase Nu1 subunit (DNA packaging protein)
MIKEQRTIVGTQKLAEILDLTDRRIQQLVTEGVLQKEGRGQYDLVKSVQSYIAFLLAAAKAKQSTGTKLEEETLNLAKKNRLLDIEIELKEGELIPKSVVKQVWSHMVMAARTRMLAIASKVKTRHPDMDIALFNDIDKEVRECMEDMSHDGLPESYRRYASGDGSPVGASS